MVTAEMRRKFYNVIEECKQEVSDAGIKYGNIVSFDINTRAKSFYGITRRIGISSFKIEICERMLMNDVDIKGLKNVCIHEILHTCNGCFNHGVNWKNMANIMNCKYGYNIKRTLTAEEAGIKNSSNNYNIARVNHKIVCQDCGCVYTRERTCKLVEHPEKYRCGKCHGRLVVEF